MIVWSTACPDWEERIVSRQSLIPFGPLFPAEADAALAVFKSLRIVDAPGSPTFGEACEPWVFDFVSAIFGAYDHSQAKRLLREFFLLISKKNAKSTIAAGIMLTALIRNWRHSAELLILAPTIEVANNAFHPARDMVRADPALSTLLHVQENLRVITHRVTKAVLKVIAADSDVVSGKKAAYVLVDELWLFGRKPNADAMMRDATGGLVSRPEGFVIFLSTQSDTPPAGIFKAKLDYFRAVRDGRIVDNKSLGVIYEFPDAMVSRRDYMQPENFYVTNPNMGRSVSEEWLEDELVKAQGGAAGVLQTFLAKHLNVEIGLALRSDAWAGAEYWRGNHKTGTSNVDGSITLDALIARCDVIVFGIDGGGLDDLLGLCAMGRDAETGKWLAWHHAWAHEIVKERRKDIAAALEDYAKGGDLTFVRNPGDDVAQVAELVRQVADAGLLPDKDGIGVDTFGVADIVKALVCDEIGVPQDCIVGIPQGWQLNGAIKTAERNLAGGTLVHAGAPLMDFCVGNAKVEARGNAVTITKQAAGSAKIDPLVATFNAVVLLGKNPQAGGGHSYLEKQDLMVL